MAVASVLLAVALMVKIFNGDPDGWVDAGMIIGLVSIVPLYLDGKTGRRAR